MVRFIVGLSVCEKLFWILFDRTAVDDAQAAMMPTCTLVVVLTLAWGALGVMMSPEPAEEAEGTGARVDHCLKDGPVLPCLNAGALEYLEEANQRGGLEVVDGLQLVQDDGQAARTIVHVDHNPNDFRSLWDATAMFLERRSLRWDMGLVYPGLTLRVGPTLTGHGILEFLLDRHKHVDDRTLGTGRLILKRTLLPILLGIKLNVVTLVPIVFGILILLIKKALFISKAALLLSSVLGYNSLQHQQHLGAGLGSYGGGGYGLHQGLYTGASSSAASGHQFGGLDSLEDVLYKAQRKYRQDLPFVSTNSRDFSWAERDRKKSV